MKSLFRTLSFSLGAVSMIVLTACAAESPLTPQKITQAPPEPPVLTADDPVEEIVEEPRYLLGTLSFSDSLAIMDPSIREGSAIVESIVVGEAPWGVVTHVERSSREEGQNTSETASNVFAYVATAEGLAVVDLQQKTRTALVAYQNQPRSIDYGEYRQGGLGLAVSPSGDRVYVAVNKGGSTSALEVFDTASESFVGSVDVGLRPFDVLIAPDGSQVYTIDHDTFTVTVVDAASLATRAIEVAPFGTVGGLGSWEKPHYGVVDADGKIMLPYQGQALAILDPVTGKFTTERMTSNTHQHGVALTPDQALMLVVGTGEFGSATAGPSLTVRSMADGSERVVPLTKLHETVTAWTNPVTGTRTAVLGGGYTRAGSWDGATVVELDSLETYEISVPGRPQVVIPLPVEATPR
ncbi:hypothetical protein [Lysinibacter sp. HNR]|uniref:YncE family protein n=1 Tax=Lysinibacter sp. HNR TaxID=3031408 RepID=UPI002434FF92|nr:hypothetical protein [Lysinibacter sp. HNR]WGD38161.1 hypothetical protein FrondiHNR_04395 [Lysinibacter sp. HNR]